MASTYSSNLKTNLIGTGDQPGTWGNTTNFNLGTLLEQAISSHCTQQFNDADITLTMVDGADAGSNTTPGTIYTAGTTSVPVSARNMYIECQGTISSINSLILPTNKKLYGIYNNTTGALYVKTASGYGVSLVSGARGILVCDGVGILNALGDMSFQNKDNVNIQGGTINNTDIGTYGQGNGDFLNLYGDEIVARGTVTGRAVAVVDESIRPTLGMYAQGTSGIGFNIGGYNKFTITDNYIETVNGIRPRTTTTTDPGTLTWNSRTNDMIIATAVTTNLTIAADSATAKYQGQKILFRIKATSGTPTLTLNAQFRAMGVIVPISLTVGNTLYMGCIYNTEDSKWDVVALTQGT